MNDGHFRRIFRLSYNWIYYHQIYYLMVFYGGKECLYGLTGVS